MDNVYVCGAMNVFFETLQSDLIEVVGKNSNMCSVNDGYYK